MFVKYKDIFRFSHNRGIMSVTMAIIVLFSVPSILPADTIVSGKVFGHWYSDDNPFIVENTIWIDIEDSLQIHEGVEVLFTGNDSLIVFSGVLSS